MSKTLQISTHAPNATMPVRLTREQSRAQTRERILGSAAIVFTREGFAGASVDRIAEQAGYSKGAIYSNFASKDVLFLELVEHYANGEVEALCARIDAAADAEAVIVATCTWASELQHEPDIRLLILDLIRKLKGDTDLTDRRNNLFDAQWHAVGTRLLRIFASNSALPDPTMLGGLVMELAYGNAVQLHAAFSAGDLIGLALRALSKSSASTPTTDPSPPQEIVTDETT
jgi:AcrR family transcriptional regulator